MVAINEDRIQQESGGSAVTQPAGEHNQQITPQQPELLRRMRLALMAHCQAIECLMKAKDIKH